MSRGVTTLRYTIRRIDYVTHYVGQGVKWLLLIVTLLSAGNAVARKTLDLTSNGMLEMQWYMYAAVFLLGSASCLQQNGHIRIDFLSARIGAKGRNIVDIIGFIFIVIPFCYFMISLSWGYFISAWTSGEMSGNAGGLVRWPVYLLLPAGFSLLLVQSLAEIAKRSLYLKGLIDDPLEDTSQEAVEDVDLIDSEQAKTNEVTQ